MRRIYTFGGRPAERHLTVADLQAVKGSDRKLTMVNPTTGPEAAVAAAAGIDIFGIWDTQMDEIRAAAPHTFICSSMSWDAYATRDDILRAAISSMEKGADCFYTCRGLDIIEMLARERIPVQSHVGLIPRFSTWSGGLRAIGRTAEEAMGVYRHLKQLESAGCVCVEIECVAEEALRQINPLTSIVTMSLGSGSAGDVISLFMSDICGESDNPPRHARAFGDVARLHRQIQSERQAALEAFRAAVNTGDYPGPAESIGMSAAEYDKLAERLAALGAE